MKPTILLGFLVGTALSVLAWQLWGETAGFAAALFAVLATVIQLGAVALIKPVQSAPVRQFMARWGAGMALRFLGVVLVALAVLIAPERFPPLAVALGFLGTLLPLLFLEAKRVS